MSILASSLLIVSLILIGSQTINAVTYTRWGQTACPTDSTGATLVYEGMTAGSKHSESGGGAQYICLPKEPEYWSVGVGGPHTESFLYGAEYHLRLYPSQLAYTAPCAVCLASNKTSVIMIPAKLTCPRSWTLEYNGYLIAEYYSHPNNVLYECLDVNVETVPGTSQRDPGASIHHVTFTCHGLPCPPYRTTKELACVVCSK